MFFDFAQIVVPGRRAEVSAGISVTVGSIEVSGVVDASNALGGALLTLQAGATLTVSPQQGGDVTFVDSGVTQSRAVYVALGATLDVGGS